MVLLHKKIDSLLAIPKSEYDTIIWDISNQTQPTILGGKSYCNHFHLDENGRCECGAYKGFISDMTLQEYTQKVLSELAVSPANDNTVIITDRAIGDEAELKNPQLTQPKYKEICWLTKAGSMWDDIPQRIKHLIYTSKTGSLISQSKFMVNPKMFDQRLLNLGKTLVINPKPNWVMVFENVHYFTDNIEIEGAYK